MERNQIYWKGNNNSQTKVLHSSQVHIIMKGEGSCFEYLHTKPTTNKHSILFYLKHVLISLNAFSLLTLKVTLGCG